MRTDLQFLHPIAYTTDGIIMRQTREGTWHTPSRYTILEEDTGKLLDLSDDHCQQIDDYLNNTTPNPFEEDIIERAKQDKDITW